MLKGRMEWNWIVSAFTISVVLLAASVSWNSPPVADSSITKIQTSKLIGVAA
jgi:hypothetical protein